MNHTTVTGSLKRKRPTGFSLNTVVLTEENRPRKVVRVMSALPARLVEKVDTCNPQKKLETILEQKGIRSKVRSYDSLPGFFEETKQEEIDSYGHDALQAVREADIEKLRNFHKEGRPLKCSNRFGESLLHLACRKALVKVVDFLLNEIEVPVRVKDDMGRSPLHDAFWTCEPNFELVDILLEKCPDLLLVSDKRGHTPLHYARQNHWKKWNEYLNERTHLVVPSELV